MSVFCLFFASPARLQPKHTNICVAVMLLVLIHTQKRKNVQNPCLRFVPGPVTLSPFFFAMPFFYSRLMLESTNEARLLAAEWLVPYLCHIRDGSGGCGNVCHQSLRETFRSKLNAFDISPLWETWIRPPYLTSKAKHLGTPFLPLPGIEDYKGNPKAYRFQVGVCCVM